MNKKYEHNDYPAVLPLQKCIAGLEVKNLSDAELIAVILGNGIKGNSVMGLSARVLENFGTLRRLSKAGLREISSVPGIGFKKAVRLHSAFEAGKRAINDEHAPSDVNSPEAVWKFLLPEMAGLEKEEFRVLVLNNKNQVIKKTVASVGTISESLVHPREVFRDAIRESGSSIIIAHNHPSGNLSPSIEDVEATKRLASAGRIIGIKLLDHLIITDTGFLSMKERGYI